MQRRSAERTERILAKTSLLLEQLGVEGLTTIKIAEASDISVGSLYHFFPNKFAILYALGESWLDKLAIRLVALRSLPISELSLEQFIDKALDAKVEVYTNQKGLLHLVQALFFIPSLQELDGKHDDLVIQHMTKIFQDMSVNDLPEKEMIRVARAYHEMTHALLLTVSLQKGERAKNTLSDLKRSAVHLLHPYIYR